MYENVPIDKRIVWTILEYHRLTVEELQAANRELHALLDRMGFPHVNDGGEKPSPNKPFSIHDNGDLDLDTLRAHAERLQQTSREAMEHSAALRVRSRQGQNGKGKSLSRREREVLTLIIEGQTSKQIAATLGISFKTAVTHRTSIMDKLEVHQTASLVREAIRLGLT